MHSQITPNRILIVDDNELNRRLVAASLGKLGYEISGAEDGRTALAQIDAARPELVLLDITMPGMDGIEVLMRLRQRYSMLELPVIMFTADDHQDRVVEALTLGANDYLLKPLNQAVAAARIKTQITIACLSRLKDNVVRFASHDLKKPMLVISDIAEDLREQLAQHSENATRLQENLSLLDQTNRYMQAVVDGFLDQNQFQANPVTGAEELDVNRLILETRETNLRYAARKQIQLSTELHEGLAPAQADAFKVRQVLDNMVGNAIKFCPHNSQVVIRSRLQEDKLVVEIVDNGPGITAADQEKLFKTGERLSNQPTGDETSSGIGLSLCKELIEAADGSIGARSNPDQGSTFWFSLPIAGKSAENANGNV